MELEINEEYKFNEEENLLLKLQKYLNYELATSILLFLQYFASFTLILATVAALLFAPFLVYVLLRTKKKAWLIFFAIVIVLPCIGALIFSGKLLYTTIVLFIQLGLFYFFCFFLRFSVNDWVDDIYAIKSRTKFRKESLLKRKLFEMRYDKKND